MIRLLVLAVLTVAASQSALAFGELIPAPDAGTSLVLLASGIVGLMGFRSILKKNN